MSKRLLEQFAAAEAEAAIKDLGISSLPVDPFWIAKQKDIEVKPKPTDAPGVSGFLMRYGDQFGIGYATHIRNQGFINFTVSHELGHYFLPGHPEKLFPNGDGIHCSKSGFISDDECEMEADFFASALLMPESLFKEAMAEALDGFAGIEQLASLCGTSITATAIRYTAFAEHPVAVIVSFASQIDYCFMSPQFKALAGNAWIKKGTQLAKSSATYKFNQNAANVRGAKKAGAWSSLDLWVDDARQIEMKEDVVGLGSYGKTLTVLFNEELLSDEEDDCDTEDE
jgi:Zn-dependent peptidase ImmA (M78 family)